MKPIIKKSGIKVEENESKNLEKKESSRNAHLLRKAKWLFAISAVFVVISQIVCRMLRLPLFNSIYSTIILFISSAIVSVALYSLSKYYRSDKPQLSRVLIFIMVFVWISLIGSTISIFIN